MGKNKLVISLVALLLSILLAFVLFFSSSISNLLENSKARKILGLVVTDTVDVYMGFDDRNSELNVYFGKTKDFATTGGVKIFFEENEFPEMGAAKTVNEAFRIFEEMNLKSGSLPVSPGYPPTEDIKTPSFQFVNQTGVQASDAIGLRYYALVSGGIVHAWVVLPENEISQAVTFDIRVKQVMTSIKYVGK